MRVLLFQTPSYSGRGAPLWLLALAVALAALAGCASGPQANPKDPMEPLNRGVYQFNDAIDTAVLKPVASGYRAVTPQPVQTGVSNFFNNLQDVWSIVNNLLQLKMREAAESLVRVNVNTFFGLGGLINVADAMNLERHTEDFGQTLGYWGVPPGPYVVLPLLGPSTLRDTLALPVDWQGDLTNTVTPAASRNALVTLRVVDVRSKLLQASNLLEQAALDKYSFTRDAYLQRRLSQVYDGQVPEENPDTK